MTMSQKHRTSIYRSLSPLLGEEETEALLSQFPDRDDELVTRHVLRAELAEFRTEFRSELAELRVELHDKLREMTMWMVGAIIGSVSLAVTLSAVVR